MNSKLSEVMTGKQIRAYMQLLAKESSPHGMNKYYPDKRKAAKQQLDAFFKSKWRQVKDEAEV